MTAPSLIRTLGGTSGFGEDFLNRNDDGSTAQIDITSIFENGLNFFGQTYTSLWINNNGSVTFNGSLGTYTPSTISSGTTPGIFPYWGDVDTRNADGVVSPGGTSQGTNLVWYDFDTANDRFIVTWDDVGFFSLNNSRQNAFQLIIEDASDDPGRSPGDFDIHFRYENIDWTAGNASGGSGGLGGTPARAGYSAGNAEGTFFELPQSGFEDALRALELTPGNTGLDGLWTFEVRNGDVPQSVTIQSNGDVIEGDSGVTLMTFTVTRFGDTSGTLSLDWTAVGFLPDPADSDDVTGPLPTGGTLFFDEGVLTQTITVEVTGDTVIEEDEEVMVTIHDAVATGGDDPVFANSLAFATIIDDDAPTPPPPPPGWEADIFGDPHLVTLDGLGYDFQAVGEFVLLESTDATRPLNVQIRTQPISDVVSITTAVAIDVGGSTVMFDSSRADLLTIDGVPATVTEAGGPVNVGGGQVWFNDGMYTIVLPSGEQLKLAVADNGAMNVCAFLSDERTAGSVQGLLGNADGDTGNDFALRDGTVLPQPLDYDTLYGAYADSWRISDAEALFDRAAGETTADWQDPSYPRGQLTVDDLPADLRAAAEAAATAAGITDPILFEAAVLDFALTGDSVYITGTTNVAATPTTSTDPANAPAVGTSLLISSPGGNPEGDAGTSSYIFTVDRIGDTTGELVVDYTIGGGVNANDIAGPLTGQITFADGDNRETIIVNVNGDTAIEEDEALTVSLSVAGGGVTFAAQEATAIVEDDDGVGVLVGTNGDDALTGDISGNIIAGLGGNDSIFGTGGDDQIFGGAGGDEIRGNAGSDEMTGEGDDDTMSGGIGFDTINGDGGNDNIAGSDGYDLINGGSGNDTLLGNNGFDTINGDDGNDVISGGLSPDELNGGDGFDLISGNAGNDMITGGNDDDTLRGNSGADTIYGNAGADEISGGINFDLIYGGGDNDTISGDNGGDTLFGNAGNDILQGNSGADRLNGGADDDILRGGIGADTFIFGEGNDTIVDFQDNIDSLEIAASLLSEATPVVGDLADYASINGDGNLVLTFGTQSLTFNNVTDVNTIIDDAVLV
jgi:hypothetical protein